MADNERNKHEREQWNNGYLSGLEWSDANYLELNLTLSENTDHLQQFRDGIREGIEKSQNGLSS